MRRKRKLHKQEFKTTVALTAIKGEITTAEMVKKFDVQAPQITQWKKQLLASAGAALDKGDQLADEREQEVLELRAKIGQLSIEDLLERGHERIYGPKERNGEQPGGAFQFPSV